MSPSPTPTPTSAAHTPPPPPSGNRLLYAAIVISTLTLGYATQAWGLALLLLFFLGLHPVLPARIRVRPRFVYHLVLLLPFAFLASEYPIHRFVGAMQVSLMYYVSFYLCALAIFRLYALDPSATPKAGDHTTPPPPTPSPQTIAYITGCTAVAFGAASMGMDHRSYIAALAVYTILLFGLFRLPHRRHALTPERKEKRTRAVIITYNFCILAALGFIVLGKEYMPALQQLRRRLWSPPPMEVANIGFDSESRLGDVSENRDRELEDRIAVRVYGANEPVYLRGQVYEIYADARWSSDRRSQRIRVEGAGTPSAPTAARPFTLPGETAPGSAESPDLEIYPERRHGAHYLLPLRARAFTTRSPELLAFHPSQVFRTLRANTSEGYSVYLRPRFTPEPPPPLETEERHAYLRIPRRHERGGHDLRERIDTLVHETFAGLHPHEDIDEILSRMEAYFADRYTYRIGISFTPGRDPLEEFLAYDRIQHGHCELFASAGVLLLRRMGIPARYVVGYVTAEEGQLSGGWIAREKHAHAWVEYLHPERGWQTLELTPSDGLPPDDGAESWREYLASLWQRSERLIEDEGVIGLIVTGVARVGGWLVRVFSSPPVVAVLLVAFLLWVVHLRLRMRARAALERAFPKHVQIRREAFTTLQKRLRKTTYEKHPEETLREYAARIRAEEDCPHRDAILASIADLDAIRYAPFAPPGTPDDS